jgi:hypothetical protein
VILAFDRINRVAVATSQDRQWTLSTRYYKKSRLPFSCQDKLFVVYTVDVENLVMISQIDTPLPCEVLQPLKLVAKCTPIQINCSLQMGWKPNRIQLHPNVADTID